MSMNGKSYLIPILYLKALSHISENSSTYAWVDFVFFVKSNSCLFDLMLYTSLPDHYENLPMKYTYNFFRSKN